MLPKISVVMPTYNHAPYVEAAIRSVLAQTCDDFELLIIDDGSTDGTPDIVRRISDPRIRFRALERNIGACGAVNMMLAEMRGEYYCILNSDDMYAPHKLASQLDFMSRHPEYAACFSMCRVIGEDGQDKPGSQFLRLFKLMSGTRYDFLRELFSANFLCHPSVMLRVDVLRKAGPFDERLRQLPDHDLWVRVLLQGNIYISPDATVLFRDHGGNTSGQTLTNLVCSTTEQRFVLDRYLEITDAEEVLEIFPALRTRVARAVPGTQAYLLAMAALSAGKPQHRAFAVETLFRTMADAGKAALLKEAYGFTWRSLHDLTGSQDLYQSYVQKQMVGALLSASGQQLQAARQIAAKGAFTMYLPLPAAGGAESGVLQFSNPNVVVEIDTFAYADADQNPIAALPVSTNASLIASGATNIYFFSVGGPGISAKLPPAPSGAAGLLIRGAVRAIGAPAATMMRDTMAKQKGQMQ